MKGGFDYITGLLMLAAVVAVVAFAWYVGAKYGRKVIGA